MQIFANITKLAKERMRLGGGKFTAVSTIEILYIWTTQIDNCLFLYLWIGKKRFVCMCELKNCLNWQICDMQAIIVHNLWIIHVHLLLKFWRKIGAPSPPCFPKGLVAPLANLGGLGVQYKYEVDNFWK